MMFADCHRALFSLARFFKYSSPSSSVFEASFVLSRRKRIIFAPVTNCGSPVRCFWPNQPLIDRASFALNSANSGTLIVAPTLRSPFRVLTRCALVFVVFVSHLLKPLNRRSLFVVLLLIADVVYHPFQILRAETNHAIACLPIQDFAIH